MGAYDNCIILIPALQPDERLTQMIHGLHERGFHKIAVMVNITDGQAHPIR